MKFIAANIKNVVIAAIVALSSSYGIAQAYGLTNAQPNACVPCLGCGADGGIWIHGNPSCFCCVPPSNE